MSGIVSEQDRLERTHASPSSSRIMFPLSGTKERPQ